MIIHWLEDAISDLQSARRYIAQENKTAANEVVSKILYNVEFLSEHPHLGRQGRVKNTRELVVPNTSYIIPYRVKSNMIEILRVFHSALEWPEKL